MPTITLSPVSPTPGSVVNVIGSGFANYKTRLKLDGAGATTNVFRPKKDGSFQVGITVSSTPKTQTLTSEQYRSTWTQVTSQTFVVANVVTLPPPDPIPGPMPVGGDPIIRGVQTIVYKTPNATVSGTTLTALQAARDAAGVGGVIRVPAGTYPTLPLTVSGQLWQLDAGAVILNQILPTTNKITVEGGEIRGGIWLAINSNAHDFHLQNVKFRNNGWTNESRSGLVVKNCDFQQIPGDFGRLFYDSTAHLDVYGLVIENNYCVRTSYSVNGVAAFSGHDGGGRKIYDPILRNNYIDNGADVGQGPGGLGAFGGFEIWGTVRQINEYNEMKGGGFLNSNVRSQDGEVRFNRWFIGVQVAWAAYESGGTGTGGDKIHDNETIGDPARNGVMITTSTPDPIKTVEVYNNKYRGVKLTSNTSAPGYNFHDNIAF